MATDVQTTPPRRRETAPQVSDALKQELLDLQSEVLARVAYGEPLASIVDFLCRRVEKFTGKSVCSVLTVDRDGLLHPLAAPSLPASFSQALEGLPIGPHVGSCGTAAYRGEDIEVRDIATDPRWADFEFLTLPLGLKACWSSPIKARDGHVIGTFAFYFHSARGPVDLERHIVAACTNLCAIAIEHQQIQQRLHDLAFVDALSGLSNRVSFDRRIKQAAEEDTPFALLLVDIDQLKSVNDTLGHVAGDALIRAVASRLETMGQSMEAFRLGGDEFALMVLGCRSEAAMADAAQHLISTIGAPFHHAHQTIIPSVTIGGILQAEEAVDVDTLRQNADFALYHGKETHRGGFVPFRAGMRTSISQRIKAVRVVGEALAEGRIIPHYQPIVRMDSAEVIGLEALARITDVQKALLAAKEFHEALTDSRIVYALTGQMLTRVAADLRRWLDMGIPFQHVGINVTTADFQRGDLEVRITDAFAQAGVPLKHIILEVNESVFMGTGDHMVAREVESLRAKGIRVALDDFGTGFASLTHLLNFPVDIIKIDKSFVDRIIDDRPSGVIVEAILDIARKLDIRVIAEGIETREQVDRLLSMGCVLGQGFHFARPASAGVTTDILCKFGQLSPI
ncbi:putative bifunctional diguanylate cyclase/phosphodiesterase [Microvirga antarctica]|uniref:putative bifunctional diguanylate cyclase/phosphodiesterase n=1 Tax=Microvirga antarctica TaxID=2819233 RepID=UPI001B30FC75|nr:EAL domain-containing protein [Microvirga antarctica]